MNVIHNFPGMYDVDMNVELYLPTEKEITKAKYDMVKRCSRTRYSSIA